MAPILSALVVCAAFLPEWADLQSARQLLEDAELAFHRGIESRDQPNRARPFFRESAAKLMELIERGFGNAALFRDQGNAFLLAADLPHAVLAYRRGLRLAPWNGDLREGLAAARAQVDYPASGTVQAPRDRGWLPSPPPWIEIGLTALTWLAAWSFLAFCAWRGFLFRGVLGFVVLAFGSGTLVFLQLAHHRAAQEPIVVIVNDDVRLRTGNGASYPESLATPLYRGVEARLLFDRNGWLQIELDGGAVGWVPRADALVDPP